MGMSFQQSLCEPVEDVFPIEDGDIPASYVSLPEGITQNHLPNRCILLHVANAITFLCHFAGFVLHFPWD